MDIMSIGLTAASTIMGAQSQARGAAHQAQQAVYRGQEARINAHQTDAYYRDDLRKTLANIGAIRASAGAVVDSPTSMAIRDENARVSDNQRAAKVTSYRAQARQSDEDSRFYQSAAKSYLRSGYLAAGAGLLKDTSGLIMNVAKGSF